MARDTRPAMPERPPRVDADGVRTYATQGRNAWWLVGLAIAVPIVVTFVAVAIVRYAPSPTGVAPPAAAPERVADAAAEPASDAPPARKAEPYVPRAKLVARRLVAADREAAPAGAAADTAKRERKKRREISAVDAITFLREEGETEGIAAFPLPGTKPIKAGIIVPEEVELPPGYVRHYQTTDDGEQLPAILMFHPDFQFFTEQGSPVTVPADLIVPESMVPPGIPIERLEPPQAAASAPTR